MRRLSVLITSLALVALAAACGGSHDSPVEVVTRAPDATISETTAKVAMKVVVSVVDLPKVTTSIDGAVDFAQRATAMTVDLSDTLGAMGAPVPDATLDQRTRGTVLYMRSPLLSQAAGITPGKWLKFDMTELSRLKGVDLSQLEQAGQRDPRQGLAFLEGVTKDGVDEDGHEDVRGVATTRYRAEVDVEKAIDRSASVTDRDAFKRYVDALGTKTVHVTVWIDGENRVRRIRIPLRIPYKSGTADVTITMEYFDFGAQVDVAPPPDSDVVDYGNVLSGG